jgi:PKHD-type hydroxylase
MKHGYMVYENAVPSEMCNKLIASFDDSKSKSGLVGFNKALVNKEIRDTDVQWLDRCDPIECILARFITRTNREAVWNFDLTEPELVQIGKYAEGQFYNTHMDCFVKTNDIVALSPESGIVVPLLSQRKISASLLLNDGSEYEGGDLIILDEVVKVKKQGTIIVFPSFMAHSVTPVTKGIRYTAVCWMNGPKWK